MALLTRRTAYELLSVLQVLATIFMAWKALACVTNSPAPIVVVTSESMEPTFQIGDVLFLWNRQSRVAVGDVAVLWFSEQKLPMVHRVVRTHLLHDTQDGVSDLQTISQYVLTKGDNNDVDDALLYPNPHGFASRQDIVGVVRGIIPRIGWPFIKINQLLSRPTRYVL